MSTKKRTADAYVSDDGFVQDDTSDAEHQPKKPKTNSGASKANMRKPRDAKAAHVDENGDQYWELNAADTRRVTVNKFSGKNMVNIREYYEKDGKKLPGKKGISMTMEQYAALLNVLPQIESALKEKGERVPRPKYGGITEVPEINQDSEGEDEKDEKKNFEATSDEDE